MAVNVVSKEVLKGWLFRPGVLGKFVFVLIGMSLKAIDPSSMALIDHPELRQKNVLELSLGDMETFVGVLDQVSVPTKEVPRLSLGDLSIDHRGDNASRKFVPSSEGIPLAF
ncbi:hypothetical protein F0562_001986 [Nyssa sinensis]|uniref:Uncharacterized protein n=1 Tax=Nyssa sinensis TaxID=561372 RepID=A0A5J5C8I6_9ASTE|nr:hypothetical protein F0562_001986 [Nyssa sinensis]